MPAIAARTAGSNANGVPSGIPNLPGVTLRMSKAAAVADDEPVADLVGGRHVERVQQFGERHRRRPVLTGVLVGAGVGDDDLLGGRADRVEQQPVLGADVALAGHRVAGERVVTVDDSEPWNTPSSRPTRTTRCSTERIGTMVHTVSVPVRKLAR